MFWDPSLDWVYFFYLCASQLRKEQTEIFALEIRYIFCKSIVRSQYTCRYTLEAQYDCVLVFSYKLWISYSCDALELDNGSCSYNEVENDNKTSLCAFNSACLRKLGITVLLLVSSCYSWNDVEGEKYAFLNRFSAFLERGWSSTGSMTALSENAGLPAQWPTYNILNQRTSRITDWRYRKLHSLNQSISDPFPECFQDN